jgi:hypothetical protein
MGARGRGAACCGRGGGGCDGAPAQRRGGWAWRRPWSADVRGATQLGMKVVDVERIVCEVPFTERQARITEREVYTWNVVELCKVTLDSGLIGCESLPHCLHLTPVRCAPVRSPRANAGVEASVCKNP